VIDWYNSNLPFKKLRYEVHKIDNIKTYYCYFINAKSKFKKEIIGDNCYIVEFPNSFKGMQQYFQFIKEISPKYLFIHDLVGNFVIDYLTAKLFKLKNIAKPRGMNYYWDFIFRKEESRYKEGFIGFVRKYLNYWTYSATLRNADLVVAPPILSLECELLRRKPVYTSNYLLGIGSMGVIMSENLPITQHWQSIYDEQITQYQHKLFTFNRVEKIKIGTIIEDYLAIKNKINGSSCLIMIGSGNDLKWYKNQYKNHPEIIFLGFIDREEAFPLIKKLDLFIAPQGGNALVEVGLLGIPAVAYNIDIMTYYVNHRINGYLVDWKTPQDFQDILLHHFKLSNEQRYDMKVMTKKTYELQFNKESFLTDRQNLSRKILAL
jgi:glycosyltransferase involved in cell wall biosynthesis